MSNPFNIYKFAPVKSPAYQATGSMTVDVLDHDGSFLVKKVVRFWDCAGNLSAEVATTPYCVRQGETGPFVSLHYGTLIGLRARKETQYWLGID